MDADCCDLAPNMWQAYSEAATKAPESNPLPRWYDLGETRQGFWLAAARVAWQEAKSDNLPPLPLAVKIYEAHERAATKAPDSIPLPRGYDLSDGGQGFWLAAARVAREAAKKHLSN